MPWVCIGLAVMVLAVTGCGADSDRGDASPSADRPRTATAPADRTTPPAPKSPATQPTDGTLKGPDGKVIRNWGDPADRRATIATFRDMVADFRAGDLAGACEHVSEFALASFPRGEDDLEMRCPQRLQIFARTLEQKGAEAERLRLLWVRSYADVSGIWVEDADGQRFRVPFQREGDDWLLELGVFPQPEVLNAELVGPG